MGFPRAGPVSKHLRGDSLDCPPTAWAQPCPGSTCLLRTPLGPPAAVSSALSAWSQRCRGNRTTWLKARPPQSGPRAPVGHRPWSPGAVAPPAPMSAQSRGPAGTLGPAAFGPGIPTRRLGPGPSGSACCALAAQCGEDARQRQPRGRAG